MSVDAVFVQDGERFVATDLGLGPWAPGALHGGAPAALLVHCLGAAAPEALALARVTYEFVRPVPMGTLEVEVSVVRPGRRVTLLDGMLREESGTELVRARALFVAPSALAADRPDSDPPVPGSDSPVPGSDSPCSGPGPPFPGPAEGAANDWSSPGPRRFAIDAMEIRFVAGRFSEPGPATAWFRLRYPLIAGRLTAPLELMAAAGDFGNGIASVLSWDDHMFINPDLTLYVERAPVGEWVALQSQMRVSVGSVATAESLLWDERGRIGRAVQSLVVGPR